MKYNRIFWLEDHPDILGTISKTEKIDLNTILNRVAFAHDFESGREIVSRRNFDIYILDGDFPDKIDAAHLSAVQKCLDGMRRGELSDLLDAYSATERGNNFVRFYQEHLSKGCDVVLFSASLLAVICGYHLGLPSYLKGYISETSFKETVRQHLADKQLSQRLAGKCPQIACRADSFISSWECGGISEFAERYLR